jgi:hypothetical protein
MKKTVDKIPFYRLGWNKDTFYTHNIYHKFHFLVNFFPFQHHIFRQLCPLIDFKKKIQKMV